MNIDVRYERIRTNEYRVVHRTSGVVIGTVAKQHDGWWLAVATNGGRVRQPKRWLAVEMLPRPDFEPRLCAGE